RRVMLGDLVREVARAAGNPPLVGRPRADACRALGLELDAHDLTLPLAVPFELVDVREHVLGSPVDLDRFADRHSSLLRSGSPHPRASSAGRAQPPANPAEWPTNPTRSSSGDTATSRVASIRCGFGASYCSSSPPCRSSRSST